MTDTSWNKGIIAWFAGNSVAANLMMIVIVCLGFSAAFSIKKETNPRIDIDLISITVPYLGAAPEEVEEGVLVKVEEAVQDIEGIKKITSRASEGSGRVNVEVATGYDVQDILDQVKLRVDAISTFPGLTEKPVISQQVFKQAVTWLAVSGNADERTLKEYAQSIRDEIAALPDVTDAVLLGARDYEISIELSENRLREYGLTFDEVVTAVRASSLDLPGGSVKTPAGDILLRTKGQAYTGSDFSDVVLRTNTDGTRVTLGDVASINDGFEETEFYIAFNGDNSVAIRVSSVGDQNELDVAGAVRGYVEAKKGVLPQGISVDMWADVSYYLSGRLNLMLKNLLTGAVLVFLVLTLFLRWKVAFWVIIGIPISFLGAIWLMSLFGISINMLSLFAFILVLGIVVDDAIIIGESCYTEVREKGHSRENVVRGAKRVALPATFGVLTTIAAFAPLLFLDVVVSPFFIAIGGVVIACLIFSLVESKLILPAHLAHMRLKKIKEEDRSLMVRLQRKVSNGLRHFVETRYAPVLDRALENRYTTVSLFFAALIVIFGTIGGGQLRFEIFPNVAGDFLQGELEMNEGTAESVTQAALQRMSSSLDEINQEYAQDLGFEPVQHVLTFTNSASDGQILVELVRDVDAFDAGKFTEDWRERIGELPGARKMTVYGASHIGGGAPLEFQLTGSDYLQLDAVADQLVEKLREYDGIFDIRNSFATGTQEVKLKIKPSAEVLGLSQSDLANQVRQGFYGAEVQRIQRGKEEVKVMVRYPRDSRTSLGDLENMRVRTRTGEEVPFSAVADIEIGPGFSSIQRVNRQRAVTVSADIESEKIESAKVIKEISEEFLPAVLADYPGVNFGLEGSSLEQQKFVVQLLQAFALAMFAIYALMAIPLRSYGQPLIIMFVIPFGMIGAMLGHMLLGHAVSMMSLFGIVALAGVVVNDSLIMVDFVNKHRAAGMTVAQAARAAGTKRFRAILLTSLTTFFGLVPMLLETSLQAQFMIPMAISLAFGIAFATVITLFLIPCLYLILEDFKGVFSRTRNDDDLDRAEDRTRELPVSGSESPVTEG